MQHREPSTWGELLVWTIAFCSWFATAFFVSQCDLVRLADLPDTIALLIGFVVVPIGGALWFVLCLAFGTFVVTLTVPKFPANAFSKGVLAGSGLTKPVVLAAQCAETLRSRL
jgi:hypothetical protein